MDLLNPPKVNTLGLKTPLPNGRVIFLTQIIVRPLIYIIRFGLIRSKQIDIRPDHIDNNLHYVIAANHGSWLDPLVIMYHFPLKVFVRLGPFRVMVLNKLFDSILRPAITMLGSFPAKPHRSYRFGLDLAQQFLDDGTTIGIFPEGRRNLDGTIKPRRGVAELANQPNTRLIPVHISWTRIFHKIPTYKIHIGKPQNVSGRSAEEIMQIIYSLPL
jgi:1-acyl-sn-glycerol-3-phosphate acyltransferase